MHAHVDGVLVDTFAKPSKMAAWVRSSSITVGAHELVIYAESSDYGDTIRCDVFLDGYSYTDGGPVEELQQRAAIATQANSRFTSPFDSLSLATRFVQTSIWLFPLLGIARGFAWRTEHSALAVGAAASLFCLADWAVAFALLRFLDRAAPKFSHRRLVALGTAVFCCLVDVGLLILISGTLLGLS
jgi:hypothetical protein